MYTTIIDVQTLSAFLDDPAWVVVDCRFDLGDTAAGRRAYVQGHVPGAVYAHLDDDLSGPPVTDSGRHPLPTPAAMAALFSRLGVADQTQVVVYDDANGAYAARLWWMLRYMGHTAVAVLDGGWLAWQAAGLPTRAGVATRAGVESNPPARFEGAPRADWLVQIDAAQAQPLLVDSRDGARYRGEVETLDPRAGHVPGAVNYYYRNNWGADGRYLPPEQLRANLAALLGTTPAAEAAFYCGSGVTACVNLLALAHAGLGDGRLFVGSWSEWSRDPARPVAVGPNPGAADPGAADPGA